ncbi:uncharacterized protein LOC128666689 isoform X2 [Bombina bombina]|uniref:uncharacterized protein LOC128666689 isoform X2 n=1 Tax=Bombina bombina TaxID=8345 RepID=UPI00235ADD74|nr:uncharacterized protein LOC128666689 isoform X2 [Bombina bombina]
MSDKNQTLELPDAHGGCLEENPGTGLLNVKEEDETDDMNSHQTEIHWSLPAGCLEENPGTGLLNVKEEDETDDMNSHQTEIHWSLPADGDKSDIVKVEKPDHLSVRPLLGAPDKQTNDSISPNADNADIVKVEITEDLFTCDQVKTEEDDVPINTSAGEITNYSNPSDSEHTDACFNLQIKEATWEKLCSEYGECVTRKSNISGHQKSHTRDENHFRVLNVGNVLIGNHML